jgi:uncharacterized membrane protein YfcA
MQFIILGFIILSFIFPNIGSWIFIIFIVLLDLWIILAHFSKIKLNNKNLKYSIKEAEVIERYHIFFRYPFISRILSQIFSGIQLSTFVLVPWLLFNQLFLQAFLIGLNYFIAVNLSVTLNPQLFLHDNIDKKKIKDKAHITEFTEDMLAIDSALKKMYSLKK